MKTSELKLAEGTKYLFTDFFDTLIYRKCHPEEIKRKWCARIIDVFDIKVETSKLYKLRVQCEAEICNVNLNLFGEGEFKYNELLNLFHAQLQKQFNIYTDRGLFLEIAENIELAIEKDNQLVNTDELDFIAKERSLGKKVIVVSDFYMTGWFIQELAKYHGFDECIDKYYVSSDFMKTKRTGSLYSEVIKLENINKSEVFMMGDNYHSDYEMSKQEGIFGHHIVRDFSNYELSLSHDKNNKLVKAKYHSVLNDNDFQFNWMSIPLYVFTSRLYNKLIRDRVKNVIFLAREGEFLKELFDLYQASLGVNNIKTHYMYASRRGTYLPSLNKLHDESFDKLFNQYREMSVEGFLKSIGLNNYLEELKSAEAEIDFSYVHLELVDSKDFSLLIQSEVFQEIYDKERMLRRSYMRNYLDDLIGDEDIHVVDVGWKGSIQDNIQAASERKVTGYYCGVLSGAKNSNDNTKHGLLFHGICNSRESDSVYNEFRASYEVFCAASHGSLIRYTNAPIYGELEDNKYEADLYKNEIRPLQLKIKDVFLELITLKKKYSRSTSEIEEKLMPYYSRGIFFPTKSEMDMFSKLKHYENFGCFDYSEFDNKVVNRLSYLKGIVSNPSYNVGKEWWKPLGFTNNGCGFLKYPYYFYRKIKLS